MKRLSVLIVLSLIIISGCKKYEEGPLISLRSKKERLANTWILDKATLNGVEVSLIRRGFWAEKNPVIFTKGNECTLIFQTYDTGYDIIGTWAWCDSKQSIITTTPIFVVDDIEYPSYSDTLTILKLKEDELWLLTNESILYQYIPY